MPIIESTYIPKFPFTNTHFNTTFRTFFSRQRVVYERKRLELQDGDFIDLDFSTVGSQTIVIALHGLEGSSQSNYVITIANMLNKHKIDLVALNLRGCSDEPNRLYESYHSGKTDDLELVINHMIENYNYQNIILLGYSLGGNITLKYLGEQSEKINKKIKCALAISVPCDLAGSSKELAKQRNKLYMLRFLKRLKIKALHKLENFPSKNLDKETIQKAQNFNDFDNLYTAPAHGFKNAEDYWEKASSLPHLHNIQCSTLLISSLDDTFLSDDCYPINIAKKHKHFYLETPKHGGHVGFNQKIIGQKGFWLEKRIIEFISEYT